MSPTKTKKDYPEQTYDDRRRLKLLPGWTFEDSGNTTTWYKEGKDPRHDGVMRVFKYAGWHVIAWHADKSFTQHTTFMAAHNALIASGSPSPFEVVTGRVPMFSNLPKLELPEHDDDEWSDA